MSRVAPSCACEQTWLGTHDAQDLGVRSSPETGLNARSRRVRVDTIGGNSSELNTPSLDGCSIQSPDGLSLYLA